VFKVQSGVNIHSVLVEILRKIAYNLLLAAAAVVVVVVEMIVIINKICYCYI